MMRRAVSIVTCHSLSAPSHGAVAASLERCGLESIHRKRQVSLLESKMDIFKELLALLDEALSLEGRAASFVPGTPLLGALPELDSMAVVKLITALEERFGIQIDDDDIDGATFATVESLADFVTGRLQG
jgi:acyl carrier protein